MGDTEESEGGRQERKAIVILHCRRGSMAGAAGPAYRALARGVQGRGPMPSCRDV